MTTPVAKLAGLTERDRQKLLDAHNSASNALKVARASARCGNDCQEMLEDIHSTLATVESMLREFFNEEPITTDGEAKE